MSEAIIKIILVCTIVVAAICYLLIPKSRFAKKIKMSVALFVGTNIIGIIVGISGVIATLFCRENLIESHLWELLIMPYVLVWIYWLIIMRIQKSTFIVDEKQEFDLLNAAGAMIAGTILVFALMFNLNTGNVVTLDGGLWFPFYLFTTVTLFSGLTILFFAKN